MIKLFNIIVVDPPHEFDIAVLARALYGLIGTSFRVIVVSNRSISFRRIVEFSRIPLHIAQSLIRILKEVKLSGATIVVDPNADVKATDIPCYDVMNVVVDYSGRLSNISDRDVKIMHVRGIGLNNKTYEALSIAYTLSKRCIVRRVECVPKVQPYDIESIKLGMSIARKMLEAVNEFDNRLILEPSAICYSLRKILSKLNLFVEPREAFLLMDFQGGRSEERIVMDLYDRYMNRCGKAVVIMSGNRIDVSIVYGLRRLEYTFCLRGTSICIARDVCIDRRLDAQGIDYNLVWHVVAGVGDSGKTHTLK